MEIASSPPPIISSVDVIVTNCSPPPAPPPPALIALPPPSSSTASDQTDFSIGRSRNSSGKSGGSVGGGGGDGVNGGTDKPANNKRCLVCDDVALGYNFDAVSCESCKAFFRRNALRTPLAKCLFKADCHIDVKTRRFCQSCRLAKCFAVGMKADYILNEKQKCERKQKIISNKLKRQRQQVEMKMLRDHPLWADGHYQRGEKRRALSGDDDDDDDDGEGEEGGESKDCVDAFEDVPMEETGDDIDSISSASETTVDLSKQPRKPQRHSQQRRHRPQQPPEDPQPRHQDTPPPNPQRFQTREFQHEQHPILVQTLLSPTLTLGIHGNGNNISSSTSSPFSPTFPAGPSVSPSSSSSSSSSSSASSFSLVPSSCTSSCSSSPCPRPATSSLMDSATFESSINRINNNFHGIGGNYFSGGRNGRGGAGGGCGGGDGGAIGHVDQIKKESSVSPAFSCESVGDRRERGLGGRGGGRGGAAEEKADGDGIVIVDGVVSGESFIVDGGGGERGGAGEGRLGIIGNYDSGVESGSFDGGSVDSEGGDVTCGKPGNARAIDSAMKFEPPSTPPPPPSLPLPPTPPSLPPPSPSYSPSMEDVELQRHLSQQRQQQQQADSIPHHSDYELQQQRQDRLRQQQQQHRPVPQPRLRRYLRDEDWGRLERLCLAFESTDVRLEDDERRFATDVQDFVNRAEAAVKRIVKFAQRLDTFNTLTSDDQSVLLRGMTLPILILRSTLYYDPRSNALHQDDFFFRMESLRTLIRADDDLWERHVSFVESFHRQINGDKKTVLLVMAIVLFSPDLPGLSQREKIARHQESFMILLKRYLENDTSFGDAVYSLPAILGQIGKLRDLCRDHLKMLSPVMKGGQINPLMAEVFDEKAAGSSRDGGGGGGKVAAPADSGGVCGGRSEQDGGGDGDGKMTS